MPPPAKLAMLLNFFPCLFFILGADKSNHTPDFWLFQKRAQDLAAEKSGD
jgi:hypothetical protein